MGEMRDLKRMAYSNNGVSGTRNVLNNANVSKSYGPYEFFMAQYTSIPRSGITTAVQDALASGIHNEINSYVNFRNAGTGSFSAADILNDSEAINVIRNQAFPLGASIAGTKFGGGTLGSKYPELTGITHVGDAMRVLYQANLPGIDARMATLRDNEQDFGAEIGGMADFVQGATESFFSGMFSYDPVKANGSGFTTYEQRNIFNTTVAMTRREKTSFAYGLNSEEGPDGYDSPGNSDLRLAEGMSYEADFFDEMTQYDQMDDTFRSRRALPGSPAYLSGVPMGTELDLSGYTPDELNALTEQVKAGKQIQIPDKYGDPLTFGGNYGIRKNGRPVVPMLMPGSSPEGTFGIGMAAPSGQSYGASDGSRGGNGMGLLDVLKSTAIEQFDILMGVSGRKASKKGSVMDIVYPKRAAQQTDFDWVLNRSPLDSSPVRRGPKRLAASSGEEISPILSGDKVTQNRADYDLYQPNEEKEGHDLSGDSLSYLDERNKQEYDRVSSGFEVNTKYPAAQAQSVGSSRGWVGRDKKSSIPATDLYTSEEQIRSREEYKALAQSGVHKQIAMATRSNRAGRRTNSDVGNLPNIPGGAGLSTPMSNRNRRDKMNGSVDDGSSPMPLRDAVRQHGGGGGNTPYGPATNAELNRKASLLGPGFARNEKYDKSIVDVTDNEIAKAFEENRSTGFFVAVGSYANLPEEIEKENIKTAYLEERARAAGFTLGDWTTNRNTGTRSTQVSRITQGGNTPPPPSGPDDPYGPGPLNSDDDENGTPRSARASRPAITPPPASIPALGNDPVSTAEATIAAAEAEAAARAARVEARGAAARAGMPPPGGPPPVPPSNRTAEGPDNAVPNGYIRDALYGHSARRATYNPSINPLQSAGRAFARDIEGDMGKWNDFTGDTTKAQFAGRTADLFNDYLVQSGEGHGNEFVNANVPEPLRRSFEASARVGTRALTDTYSFNKRTSLAGVEEYFSEARRGETSGEKPFGVMGGYAHPQLGTMQNVERTTANGEIVSGKALVNGRGQVTIGPDLIAKGETMSEEALQKAVSTTLPSEPASAIATIRSRVDNILRERVDEFAKGMIAQGTDSKDAVQTASNYLRDASMKVTRDFADGLSSTLQGTERSGAPTSKDAQSVRYGAKKPANIADAQAILDQHPKIAAQVEDYKRENGVSLEQMMNAKSGQEAIFGDDDMDFQFGGKGGDRDFQGGSGSNANRQKGQGGLFNGKFGAAMYAAYVGKRMWSMGMGETMQSAKAYGGFASDVGRVAGPDQGILGTDSGYAARQSIGQAYQGRAAMQEFGAFMDIPFYMAASGNEGLGRFTTAAAAGVTTGAEIAIGGAMIGQMGGEAFAGIAKHAGTAGMAVAIGMTATAGIMELYNAANPYQSPVTPSSILKGVVDDAWRIDASAKFYQDHPEERKAMEENQTPQWWDILGSMGNPTGHGAGTPMGYKAQRTPTPELTSEQLKEYLTPAQYGSMYPKKNALVEAAIKNSGYWKGYGLDDTGTAQANQALFNATGEVPTEAMIDIFGASVQRFGVQAISEAEQYSYNRGFAPGTPSNDAAMQSFASAMNVTSRDNMKNVANRYASIGSQMYGYIDPTARGAANQIAEARGINTQQQASVWQGVTNTAASFQNGPMSRYQMDATAMIAAGATPYQGQMINQLGNLAGEAGYDPTQAMAYGALANLTPQQWAPINALMSGDLKGASYFANQQRLDSKWGLFDKSGAGIQEVSGSRAMQVASNWAGTGATWIPGSQSGIASRFLGTNNQEILGAFMENGTRGIEKLSRDAAYAANVSGAGIQARQIAQQENYLWGGGTGGTWNNPTTGSSWGIQDYQRDMQYGFQQNDFAASARSMEMSNRYVIGRENNQQTRMNVSQGYNSWQMDTQQNASIRQRGWTQEDWQYQDTSRGLNFEWTMQDFDENIRFASGRDRKKLVRDKDRAALSYNLEEDQIDTQRSRQKELWVEEDDRFTKQKEYTLTLNSLDRQSFESNRQQRVETYAQEVEQLARRREELEQSRAVELAQITLDRENQYMSIQLSKENAQISLYAAQKQHEYNEALITASQNWEQMMGPIQDGARYDAAGRFMEVMGNMASSMASMPTEQPGSITWMIESFKSLSIDKVNALTDLIKQLSWGLP